MKQQGNHKGTIRDTRKKETRKQQGKEQGNNREYGGHTMDTRWTHGGHYDGHNDGHW